MAERPPTLRLSPTHSLGAAAGVASAAVLSVSLFASAPLPSAEASPLDPTVPKTIVVGTGGALWPTARGDYGRTGRSPVPLPHVGKTAWSRGLSGRIEYPPLVDDAGTTVVVTAGGGVEGTLVQLAKADGKPLITKLDGAPIAAPALLGNGTRVVVTPQYALGYGKDGVQRFKTLLEGGGNAVVSMTPLPTGGFALLRGDEVIELDGQGVVAGRTKLAVLPRLLAARDGGEVVGVGGNGEVWSWRAGKLPRLLGKFPACTHGVAVVRDPSGKQESVVCASDNLVDQLDVATGKRKALLGKGLFPFRTAPALDGRSAVLATSAYGILVGTGVAGEAVGPYEVPGAQLLLPGKEVSVALGGGEIAPIVDEGGTWVWGGSDGVAAGWPGAEPVRLAKCDGLDLATLAGFAPAGPKALVVACRNGRIELHVDGP